MAENGGGRKGFIRGDPGWDPGQPDTHKGPFRDIKGFFCCSRKVYALLGFGFSLILSFCWC